MTDRAVSITAYGEACNFKSVNSQIVIEKIIFREYRSDADGEIILGTEKEIEVLALAELSQLAAWPKEYRGKKILLTGFLRQKEPLAQKPPITKVNEVDLSLFAYHPYTPYFFENYSWELAE